MAVRKTGSRRIVVDGVTFRWRFPHRPTQDQKDGWPGVRLTVQPAKCDGALLVVVFPHRFLMGGPCGGWGKPVLPSEVARAIREALAAGWRADQRSEPFVWLVRGQAVGGWKSCGVVIEGRPIDVGGINPWAFPWVSLQQPPVELPHPAYPNQCHKMWLYEVEAAGKKIVFAAGELSPNVWGFYVPAEPPGSPDAAVRRA